MRKKILFIFLMFIGLFFITGCGSNNKTDNGKSYNVNGLSIKLDTQDERETIQYKTSSQFEKDYKSTTSTYAIYKDNKKDKYDLSNLKFRLDVNVDIMNLDSSIEKEKRLVLNNDNFNNVLQDQKTFNGITWEYFSFNNVSDKNNVFEEHLYILERQIEKYYYVYKVYFSFAEDIDEFEEAFMNSIVFE